MNRYARCSSCGAAYQVANHAEKRDPDRKCARCYVTEHQQPLDFLDSLRAREGRIAPAKSPTAGRDLPAASAAGSFESGTE